MINFDKVSKIYAGDFVALDDVSLVIKPKEFVSIVGHSGAGKTTLLKMILAEEEPSQGAVYFESQNVHAIPKRELHLYRRKIGVVFQDFRLMPNKTAYENIAFAMEAAGRDDVEIEADVPHVLDLVGLADKAFSFPRELSGGERQRVAIARAMLKDSPILILDEATSSLDSVIERSVQEAFVRLMENRTTIVIAHRLSTIRKMDRILVLNDGEISEEGSHVELLEKRGSYYDFWSHQIDGFTI